MKKVLLLIAFSLLLGACASTPIVDTKGVDPEQYKTDLAECEALSEQVDSTGQIAKSAAFGALVMGALGTIADNGNAGQSASVGAVQGGSVAALSSDQEKFIVLKNCLKNRGYVVLN